jgi:hypothetical protein
MVFVVDDDASVRASIQGLLKSARLRCASFATAEEFLRDKLPDGPSCLVLDVSLPGVNGLEFQRQLADAGVRIPIIFITGHGDIPMPLTRTIRSFLVSECKSFRQHCREISSETPWPHVFIRKYAAHTVVESSAGGSSVPNERLYGWAEISAPGSSSSTSV